ncbi:MAG: NAD(P)-dependent oxidoreductase [Bdellovibrionales bacterium]|nr:NAD(P)-dependent oxidoreductase [Ramlibacter sp.]
MTVGQAGTVGIVGVGNMGGGMTANLLGRGWAVQVCDVDLVKVKECEALGAVPCATPAAAAASAGALIICVVDAAQSAEVLFGKDGAAAAMQPGGTVVLCPTISPLDVESLSARLLALGMDVVDAPMSGGPARARDGSMSLMVACANAVFARQQPLLEALSSKLFRISQRPGDGARTKLVNNLLAGINLSGAAEALAMAQAMGLDLAKTLDVIEQSSGQSWIGTDRMRRALAGDYAPRAHVTLLEKDTRLAVEAAAAAGFTGPLGGHAARLFALAHEAGFAADDDAALFKLLGRKAGSSLPPPTGKEAKT